MASGSAGSEPPSGGRDRSPASKRRRENPIALDNDALVVPSVERAGDPRRGSASSSRTMQRSPSPGEMSGNVKLTKTGRVSKAAKGQRVHRCEECGKIYTRAEHLRRHRQNHQPGSFPCDVPGCGRTFNREDLLIRHKARHDDPLNQPSRRASFASQSSPGPPPDTMMPMAPYPLSAAGLSSTTPTTSSRSPIATQVQSLEQRRSPEREGRRKGYIPIRDLRPTADCLVDNGNINSGPYYPDSSWQLSTPQSSDTEYETPSAYGQSLLQPQLQLYTFGESSFPNTNTSMSPVSPATNLPYWTSNSIQMSTPSSENSFAMFGGNQHQLFEEQTWPPVMSRQSPEARDLQEQDLLATFAMPHSQSLGNSTQTHYSQQQRRYLTAFWESVHPIWPVIHRPTFEQMPSSPLLRAAVMTLGASSAEDSKDNIAARDLHDRCVKVLEKRTLETAHSFRVCDMQAIILIELYSMFQSRRPPSQLSQIFEDVYTHLAHDPDVNPGVLGLATDPQLAAYDRVNASLFSPDQQCAQRLLAACFLLDREHSVLFGRTPVAAAAKVVVSLLPFPSPLEVWDMENGGLYDDHLAIGQTVPQHHCLADALDCASLACNPHVVPADLFMSQLLGMYRMESESSRFESSLGTGSDHAATRLGNHTFALCSNTPVRDLLAVAGESWIMAKKLTNQNDYFASQYEVANWTWSSPNAELALSHAFAILKVHRTHNKSVVLFHEWSLYLAVLVIWACSYAADNESKYRPRVSIPSPSEPRKSEAALEQAVDMLVENGMQRTPALQEVMHVLLWAKSRLSNGKTCQTGLVSGAVDVLGVLCRRGCESGWL